MDSTKSNEFGWLKITGVIIVAFVAISVLTSIGQNGKPAGAARHDTMNVLDDADFLRKNPGFTDGVRKMIEAGGYECPALSELWNRGPSPYGLKLEALCGPDDGKRSAIPSMHYAVYATHLRISLCKPFEAFGPACD